MKKIIFAVALVGLCGGAFAATYSDTKMGTVKAYKRTITIDMDECQKNYQTTGSSVGMCIVKLDAPDDIQFYGNTFHAFQRFGDGIAAKSVTIDGNGQGYSIELVTEGLTTFTPDWQNVEKYFRATLAQKMKGPSFDIIAFKIENP